MQTTRQLQLDGAPVQHGVVGLVVECHIEEVQLLIALHARVVSNVQVRVHSWRSVRAKCHEGSSDEAAEGSGISSAAVVEDVDAHERGEASDEVVRCERFVRVERTVDHFLQRKPRT